jgi:hypothetical protein
MNENVVLHSAAKGIERTFTYVSVAFTEIPQRELRAIPVAFNEICFLPFKISKMLHSPKSHKGN